LVDPRVQVSMFTQSYEVTLLVVVWIGVYYYFFIRPLIAVIYLSQIAVNNLRLESS